MNIKVLIVTIVLLILAISLNIFSQAEKVELTEFSGTLKNIGGEWYLMTGGDFFKLNLATDEYLEKNNILLESKTDIIISGILVEEEIKAYKLIYKEVTLEIRNADGTNLWKEIGQGHYFVNPKLCIGCRLCLDPCPTKAITMVKGKAVIDADKCIARGFCSNGDTMKFKGCPTSAISKFEE